jgi:hypothetical protein
VFLLCLAAQVFGKDVSQKLLAKNFGNMPGYWKEFVGGHVAAFGFWQRFLPDRLGDTPEQRT